MRDKLLVGQSLGDDHVHQAIEKRDIGARLVAHVIVGVVGQRRPAWVNDNQRGAALGRLLEKGGCNRVVFSRVGADHQRHIGIVHIPEDIRHGAGTDGLLHSRDRGGVTQAGAVVHIVGAEHRADELLE